MKTYLINIKQSFAKYNNLPSTFVGVIPRKTERAVYVYGHGSMETRKTGRCCVCGRGLTHPVSVELGIGPYCGGHWWDWKLIGGYSMENVERLKKEMTTLMKKMLVDSWMPRSVILSAEEETEETVTLPEDHKMGEKKQPEKEVTRTKRPAPPSREATLIKYENGDFGIKITFPFNHDDLAKVKTLDSRRWNPDAKVWTTPLIVENIEKLIEWKFEVDPKLVEYTQREKVNVTELEGIEIPGLKMDLYDFQKKGVAFLEAKNGRALIADEMGLGKTAQALSWLQLHPEKRPVLIVVPASLKLNWQQEIWMWMSKTKIQILSGSTPYDIDTEVAIINYDILVHWEERILAFNPKVVIVDEIHYIKNNKAKRTKALKRIVKGAQHFIGLSGTPIVNRPIEFYNAINIIDPTMFPDRWSYLKRYCGAKYNGFGWDFTGATNTEELHEKLVNNLMIRRKKSEVLTELPDKIRTFMPIELSNRVKYKVACQDFIEFLKRTKGDEAADRASNAQTLAEIEGLKQLAVQGKMKSAIEWIRNFLEVDGKLVVFAVHKFVIDQLMQEFGEQAVKVDGSVSGPNRQKAVESFQNDDTKRLFVGNIKAAGVGITLTAASTVAFLELPWTPGDVVQAEDRCHRIGQKDSVNIQYLLAEGTIEEEIAALLDEKRKVLDAVLDGATPEKGSLLTELIQNYKN